MKTEYRAIDFTKLIAAFLVVAIHIPPFEELAPAFSHAFEQVICRLSVPFFFLCTGFFTAEKITDWGRMKSYLLHIIKMYLFWSILYLPCIFARFVKKEHAWQENVRELLRRFFLIGSYIQLWYLLATVVAVLLLFLAKRLLGERDGLLILLAVCIYVIGLLGNSYRHIVIQNPVAASAIRGYQDVFLTTRNGFFFGFPFVTMGYFFFQKREKIKRPGKRELLLFFLLLAGLFEEEAWLTTRYGDGSHDMYLLLPAVSGLLFFLVAGIPVSEKADRAAKRARSLSTDLFLLHMLVWFWLKKSVIWKFFWAKSALGSYLLVACISLFLAVLLEAGKRYWKKSIKNI